MGILNAILALPLTRILEVLAEVYDRLAPSKKRSAEELHNAVVKSSTTGDSGDLEKIIHGEKP